MNITDAIAETLTGRIDHRTGEGRATIALVYGRGATHCKATGEPLNPRDDVWIEVVNEEGRTSFVGLSAASFDSDEGQTLLAEWRRRENWSVEVWDGRELWPSDPPSA